jgi:hypothetical protein
MRTQGPRIGVVLGALALASLTGCGDAESKIREAQAKADERVKAIEKEGKDKLAALQKELDGVKGDLDKAVDKAKTDADEAVREAKASAEEQAKAAELAMQKAREAFKGEARAKLNDINEDLKEVNQKAAKVPPQAKATTTKALESIAKKEAQIQKDITEFDQATIATFKTVKAKVDQNLAALKREILGLKAKLR